MWPRQTARDYIEDRIERITESGCWIWTGYLTQHSSYGSAHFQQKMIRAHRLAWITYRGPIADELNVLHRCDVRCCVNPAHLFLGTDADNAADRNAKGRQARGPNPTKGPRGERTSTAKLTAEQVLRIRVDVRPSSAIAEEYGVGPDAIGRIKKRRTWRHI